jgi:hypothetical protein
VGSAMTSVVAPRLVRVRRVAFMAPPSARPPIAL